jgi:hypothetical protein
MYLLYPVKLVWYLGLLEWFLGTFPKLEQSAVCFVMSVQPSTWNISALIGWIFMKFNIWVVFENLSGKFRFHWHMTRLRDNLHEDQYTFLSLSHSLLTMRNVSDKSCRENQTTHFMFNNFFHISCHLWDNMGKSIIEPGRPHGICALHAR